MPSLSVVLATLALVVASVARPQGPAPPQGPRTSGFLNLHHGLEDTSGIRRPPDGPILRPPVDYDRVDLQVSEWSSWSPKTSIFGCSTVYRTRGPLREEKQQCGTPTREQTLTALERGFLNKVGRRGFQAADDEEPSVIDMVFVFDKSGSVKPANFDQAKQDVQNLLEIFPAPIDPANTRVAGMSFSDVGKTRVEFDFSAHTSRAAVVSAIGDIAYESGSTATAVALNMAKDDVFVSTAGSRPAAAKILFLITDGKSNTGGSPVPAADALKDSVNGPGCEIFAFAVGSSVNEQELHDIVSEPVPEHLFYSDSFTAMSRVIDDAVVFLRAKFGKPADLDVSAIRPVEEIRPDVTLVRQPSRPIAPISRLPPDSRVLLRSSNIRAPLALRRHDYQILQPIPVPGSAELGPVAPLALSLRLGEVGEEGENEDEEEVEDAFFEEDDDESSDESSEEYESSEEDESSEEYESSEEDESSEEYESSEEDESSEDDESSEEDDESSESSEEDSSDSDESAESSEEDESSDDDESSEEGATADPEFQSWGRRRGYGRGGRGGERGRHNGRGRGRAPYDDMDFP